MVAQPDRYEARVNDSVLDFARHYDCSVLPARVRKPQDKAVVESAVQVVERWIMARLRHVRLPDLIEDASNELPGMFRRLIDQLLTHLRWLDEQIETIKKEIYVWHRNNADSTDETEHLSQH